MSLNLGNGAVSKLYLGATEVVKAYLGSVEVYSSALPVTYATWNPADKTGDTILSNGNLTAESSGTPLRRPYRATIGVSSGKWYWETTIDADVSELHFAGVGNASATLSQFVGIDHNGWGFYHINGDIVTNGVWSTYGTVFVTGDVLGTILDMDAGTISFRKNNIDYGIAYSGLSGTIFPMNAMNANSKQTANFGATPMVYTAPSGFNQGLYI